MNMRSYKFLQAFTLIEISIVIIIIGLIVGGILTGRDLIASAGARATVTQIEKYNSAVRTFQAKYGYLPGDIPNPTAASFGFLARGTNLGEGNGDGVITGYSAGVDNNALNNRGEPVMVWVDLFTAGLMDGRFNSASPAVGLSIATATAAIPYFPQAKIGQNNFVYVYGGCVAYSFWMCKNTGINYFGLSAITSVWDNRLQSNNGLTTQQAYNIDQKTDDGLPQSGNVTAAYVDGGNGTACIIWSNQASGLGCSGAQNGTAAPYTTAVTGSATTCFDNGGVVGPQKYSVGQNSNVLNCGLSFRFQ